MRIENYDYSYELSDEQLLYYSALPAIAKLRWLDEARRFTLLARRALEAEENRGQTPISENRGQTPKVENQEEPGSVPKAKSGSDPGRR